MTEHNRNTTTPTVSSELNNETDEPETVDVTQKPNQDKLNLHVSACRRRRGKNDRCMVDGYTALHTPYGYTALHMVDGYTALRKISVV